MAFNATFNNISVIAWGQFYWRRNWSTDCTGSYKFNYKYDDVNDGPVADIINVSIINVTLSVYHISVTYHSNICISVCNHNTYVCLKCEEF